MSLSNTYETTTLNWLFNGSAVTRPTSWTIGVFTVAPTDSTAGTEVTGGSYARQSIAFTVSNPTATNTAAVEWPAATADWGTIVACAVFDQSGVMIAYAALTTSKTINTGDVLRLPASSLTFTLN